MTETDVGLAPRFELDGEDLTLALEAILMVAAESVSVDDLSRATGMDAGSVDKALRTLQADYNGDLSGRQRGFELRDVEGRWRLFSRSKWAPWVGAFVAGSESSTLSRAAMETLAIIAYRQPVTRMQIARIRGVNVDSVLRTLLARELVEESGESPTGAHLFRTTDTFLEKMGLNSIDDLVPLAPFVPGPESVDELALELEE